MPRQHRPWSELRAEIYRTLREPAGAFFDEDQILDLFNQEKDAREMHLLSSHEGHEVAIVKTDLVEDQALYDIPLGNGRLRRVLRLLPGSSEDEWPLERDERAFYGGSTALGSAQGNSYLPTYRLVGSQIKLEPGPGFNETDGLGLEFELLSERIDADTDTLPLDWPVFTETLLILDTVIAAYEMERTQGEEAGERFANDPVTKRRDRYAALWDEFVEERSFGLVRTQRFHQGA